MAPPVSNYAIPTKQCFFHIGVGTKYEYIRLVWRRKRKRRMSNVSIILLAHAVLRSSASIYIVTY